MASTVHVSPLAPETIPDPAPLAGLRLATTAAGIRYRDRTDVLFAAFDEGTEVAGVFTQSRCASAPVEWCRAGLGGARARGLVVNSGNANAFTGLKGREATALTADLAAKALGCPVQEIFLASTGVIGEPLDARKFSGVMDTLAGEAAPGGWAEAARAIMTTDTFPKVAERTAEIDGVPVRLVGIAKGAGMIAPDMATMLSFVFTDAPLSSAAMQPHLAAATDETFNCLTIDGDTSTSDTLLLFATGKAAAPRIDDPADPRLASFRAALQDLLGDLARLVARDGEGARKFVTVTVKGAESRNSARRVALSIANSPLVKTAVAGEDANWGRVVMAVGKAGEPADRDRIAISFNGIRVAKNGARDPSYDEAKIAESMEKDEIAIDVDLGIGEGKATVWTCDLTKEYVAINGDYRS